MGGMGKKKKPKKQKNSMGRSLMHNKLRQKERSDTILYSMIGNENEENKNIAKQISVLNKNSIDDYLDNQLAISNVQVSKIFIQKNEIKEKKNLKSHNNYQTNVQNIVLPIPGRPILLNDEEKLNINLKKININKSKKKKKKNIKHITFLMKGKNLMPLNPKTSHSDRTSKPRVNPQTPNQSTAPLPEQQSPEPASEENEVENEEEENEESEVGEDEVEEGEEEEEDDAVDEVGEGEVEDDEAVEYELKYVKMYERLGKKYEREEFRSELNKSKLEKYELEHFVEWRKLLSQVEEKEGYIVTPYEKNIEYWKQLWRVIEKSHVLFYIIDARNPLFFYSKGLDIYVKKVDKRKEFIVILNKSDFLTYEERKIWAEYFDEKKIKFIFFSALRELYHQNQIIIEDMIPLSNLYKNKSTTNEFDLNINNKRECQTFYNESENSCSVDCNPPKQSSEMGGSEIGKEAGNENCGENKKVINTGYGNLNYEEKKNTNTDILSVQDLINLIKNIKNKIKNLYDKIEIETYDSPKFMVGFIGFPNVGKSSIINSIFGEKKVGVSRQPGKTKHFQTIPLNYYGFTLCDCPGLIFPSIVFNKHDLIINGVFSIDHYKGDDVDVIQVLCNIIPEQLCERYKIKNNLIRSIQINKTSTYKYMNARKFLHELCFYRKYISGGKGGVLNFNFATRLIIREFITGKLHYNFMPNYLDKYSYAYTKEIQSHLDTPEFLLNPDDGLSKANPSEDVLVTKRKFRYMQKRLIKGKNVIKTPISG
ncbi:large subunit GTPase 1, putative [Plasmodium yoelii]|uniref:Cytosolic preribosomal GTPase, putative n=1 Tax=Plasmodium yoelii TaxID=5861 RepID=A0A077YIZ0_PLAYE|nr:large subunit GTPase 1, putative [Plasmodium yoelii]CDU84988.1 cytosolic preribosomal GTPase, putative [Plasmodium yoelii]VTZ78884.1 large subunit GTPase 1, putative [Plasmodium yoelii]|eukprot:XP_022813293.1 large subunit GTPase 1, putative [Plasmodium yoelii]